MPKKKSEDRGDGVHRYLEDQLSMKRRSEAPNRSTLPRHGKCVECGIEFFPFNKNLKLLFQKTIVRNFLHKICIIQLTTSKNMLFLKPSLTDKFELYLFFFCLKNLGVLPRFLFGNRLIQLD